MGELTALDAAAWQETSSATCQPLPRMIWDLDHPIRGETMEKVQRYHQPDGVTAALFFLSPAKHQRWDHEGPFDGYKMSHGASWKPNIRLGLAGGNSE